MDAILLHKQHPYRPPDWRWQKAILIREGKLKLSANEDSAVCDAYKFQTALNSCRDDDARFRLFDVMRDIYLAYELRDEKRELEESYGGGRSHPGRYEIEARILANESFESIAIKLFATTEAIILFSKFFFDIGDRLTSPSYVFNTVIGPQLHRGLTEKNYDIIWKLFGYMWGPVAVDTLISHFASGKQTVTVAGINSMWRSFTKDTLNRKSGLASLLMPVNSFNQLQILETDAKLREIEIASEANTTVENGIMLNISEMLRLLPWANNEKSNNILPLFQTSVEPRSDTIVNLTSDGSLPVVDDIKFPEPNQKR